MAKIDVIMPQMGESIAEGTLSRWMKKVGDAVKRDEPIFEISTDKVDAEIPAPNAGVLAEILVQEGETVAVQTVVARIETDASAAATEKPRPRPPRLRRPGSRKPARRRPCSAGASRAGPAQGSSLRRIAATGDPLRFPSSVGRTARPAAVGRCYRRQRCRVHGGAAAAEVHPAGPEDGGRAQPGHQRRFPGADWPAGSPRMTSRATSRAGRGAADQRACRAAPSPDADRSRLAPAGLRLPYPRAPPASTPGRATGSSRGPASGSSPPITW